MVRAAENLRHETCRGEIGLKGGQTIVKRCQTIVVLNR